MSSAQRNNVPAELLAGVVFNEFIDMSTSERYLELWGVGSSVGPGQITAQTVLREGVLTHAELVDLRLGDAVNYRPGTRQFEAAYTSEPNLQRALRSRLLDPVFNIDVAGRLLRRYLERLNTSAAGGGLHPDFLTQIGGLMEPNFADYLPLLAACSDSTRVDTPDWLMAMAAAMWNNGPGIMQVGNPRGNANNAREHSLNDRGLNNSAYPGPGIFVGEAGREIVLGALGHESITNRNARETSTNNGLLQM